MSISRRKVKTEKEVQIALFRAKKRMNTVVPADDAIRPTTKTLLSDEKDAMDILINVAALAKYLMMKGTKLTDAAKKLARNFISAYFQTYNNGIILLGVYDVESRVLYGLAENDSSVPYMGSEANILYWGGKVETGEAARVTAGGEAMSNPTAAAVAAKVADFDTKNNNQANRKTEYTKAQANVTAEMPHAIKVVTKVWDESETFYDFLSIEAKRMKCIEYGVVYESTDKITIYITVKNKTTGALLENAVTTILENGTAHTTNAAGELTMVTTIAYQVTLETQLESFEINEFTLSFETSISVYNLLIEMIPLIN